jgi:hypothetical protein
MNVMNTDYLVAFKVYDLNIPVTTRIYDWNMGKYVLLTDFKTACVSGQIQMLNITGWKIEVVEA